MKILHQEVKIEEVFKHYAEGFTPPSGEKIVRYDTHYDPRKGTVIFILVVDDGKKLVV